MAPPAEAPAPIAAGRVGAAGRLRAAEAIAAAGTINAAGGIGAAGGLDAVGGIAAADSLGPAGGIGRALLKSLLLLAGLLAAGFTARGLGAGSLLHAAPGAGGKLVFVGAAAALAAAGVPRQAVAFAGGYAFGLWQGGALALLAQMLGCVADFWWARVVARAWATRRIAASRSTRLARFDRFLAAHPFSATLTLRLLPVGNNLALNLVAGVSGMAAGPFLAASLLGYLPQTLVFSLAGSGTQVDRPYQIGLAAVLFVASAGLGATLLRKSRPARASVVADRPGTSPLR